jgi:hypothetical protein
MLGNHYNTFNVDSTKYNVNTSHPLIPNAQEYILYKKYLSIHSEDRDIIKYQSSSEFEIELPEDYTNIFSVKLVQWTFPANYNTFSFFNGNNSLFFKISDPYNPASFGLSDDYNYRIFQALFETKDEQYFFIIEQGFYQPTQMATELTNKFNAVVTNRIVEYFTDKNTLYPIDGWNNTLLEFLNNGGYNRFIIVYNVVSLKLWFGNRADGFVLLNEESDNSQKLNNIICLETYKKLPDYSNYGLPSYLGLKRINQKSISSLDTRLDILTNIENSTILNGITVPRFYYGEVFPGDNGYWLQPLDLSGCNVHWIEADFKLNIMGEAYMYMEIDGLNTIDETKPYNNSSFTSQTNQTNSVVNAAFAKLAVPTTPLSQWFDRDSTPSKVYYPPLERLKKLKFKIRYHNGQLAAFGAFNYSFMLEFTTAVPQILRNYNAVTMPPASR